MAYGLKARSCHPLSTTSLLPKQLLQEANELLVQEKKE